VREAVAVFAAIEYVTVPLPLPLAPEAIVSHEALLVAVHVQPVDVATLALLEPAAAAGLTASGETA